jgi:hypothetical protein
MQENITGLRLNGITTNSHFSVFNRTPDLLSNVTTMLIHASQ